MFSESTVAALVRVIKVGIKKSSAVPATSAAMPCWSDETDNFPSGKKTSKVFFLQAAKEALKNARPLTYNNFRIELAQRTLARVSESLFI